MKLYNPSKKAVRMYGAFDHDDIIIDCGNNRGLQIKTKTYIDTKTNKTLLPFTVFHVVDVFKSMIVETTDTIDHIIVDDAYVTDEMKPMIEQVLNELSKK